MTPERAKEIIQQAKEKAKNSYGPWFDQIDSVLKDGEDQEVKQVWETLPESTSWIDALYHIAKG